MSKLVTLNGNNDQEILSSIFDNEIIVFEDIQGSKIWVNWNGKEFTIKPKSMSSEKLNLVDLAIQNYYNPGIKYLESLDLRVKSLLNKNWYFAFEYFKRPDLETKIRSQQNWPGLTPLSETDKKKPDKREKWEKDVKAKKDEYFVYLNKYQEFLKKLNSDDSDPKKDMAIIDEIRKHFLWYDKAFLELIKKK